MAKFTFFLYAFPHLIWKDPGQTPLFLGKNQETRDNNLQHHRVGSVAFFKSLRLRVHYIQQQITMQEFLQHVGCQIYIVSCKAS